MDQDNQVVNLTEKHIYTNYFISYFSYITPCSLLNFDNAIWPPDIFFKNFWSETASN